MIEGILGIIDKMRIEVFPNNKFEESDIQNTIFVQVNPESYTLNQEVQYCEGQTMGATSQDLKFSKIESEEINFDFIFDSSGVLPPMKIKEGQQKKTPLSDSIIEAIKPAIANPFEPGATIEKDLDKFKELISGYDGKAHQTRYLKLLWGSFEFKCRLVSLSIEYKLFRPDGRPIRANARCNFKATLSVKEMKERQNQQSSDITHEKIVAQEDIMTLMTERIYGQNQYYIDVARINKMLSFRKLNVGQALRFPPIK